MPDRHPFLIFCGLEEGAMITFRREVCTYCGGCVSLCPSDALDLAETQLVIADERCSGCELCIKACPVGALLTQEEREPSLSSGRSEYDLVVVGAGPAGSTAARIGAERGLTVLLLEKRQEIGSPVRCAEGINCGLLLPFVQPEESWISAEVNKSQITDVDTRESRLFASEKEVGYVLERRVFDRVLAERAVAAGAQVMVKAAVTGLVIEDGTVRGVAASDGHRNVEIQASVVIGADGVESRVGHWAGLPTLLRQEDCLVCAQFMLTGIEVDPHCCCYYLGHELAPGGYAWIFPKGAGKANVGLGVQADLAALSALEYLLRFISRSPFLEQGSPVTLITGNVPVGIAPPHIISNGLMLVGDAARQADPLTGGGIGNAMLAGGLAADVACEAVEAGDTSREFLREYQRRWIQTRGRRMERNYRLKERFSAAERTSRGFLRAFAVAAVGK
jgi:digeranylgeranylglycerophospholipid reductase